LKAAIPLSREALICFPMVAPTEATLAGSLVVITPTSFSAAVLNLTRVSSTTPPKLFLTKASFLLIKASVTLVTSAMRALPGARTWTASLSGRTARGPRVAVAVPMTLRRSSAWPKMAAPAAASPVNAETDVVIAWVALEMPVKASMSGLASRFWKDGEAIALPKSMPRERTDVNFILNLKRTSWLNE
jgi:hypothetical protein